MDFAHSERARELMGRLDAFISIRIDPVEGDPLRALQDQPQPWVLPPELAEWKEAARAEALWNLFLPDEEHGTGLSSVEYAPLAERMGRSMLAAEVFDCSASDSTEVLLHFGSERQRERWRQPLPQGRIRWFFCMTEPDIASSDATNMEAAAVVEADEVILNGRKWWSTGVGGDWRFDEVYGLFRLAGIIQRIYRRYADRETRNPPFRHLWIAVHVLHRRCRRIIPNGSA